MFLRLGSPPLHPHTAESFPPAPLAWPQHISCLSLSALGLFGGRLRTECGLTQTGTSSSCPTGALLSVGLPEGSGESLAKGRPHPPETPLKLLGRCVAGRHLDLIIYIGVWGCLIAFKIR